MYRLFTVVAVSSREGLQTHTLKLTLEATRFLRSVDLLEPRGGITRANKLPVPGKVAVQWSDGCEDVVTLESLGSGMSRDCCVVSPAAYVVKLQGGGKP
eukprot:5626230-Lingulodinium_polyedra.AAC.1